MEIQTYKQFTPSTHDARGLGLPDRQDWLVCPVTQSRDSEALERSNFRVAVRRLGGESETVEVHRFGHWACGWFEILLVAPSRLPDAQGLAESLDDYPVLDEMDLSELENEEEIG